MGYKVNSQQMIVSIFVVVIIIAADLKEESLCFYFSCPVAFGRSCWYRRCCLFPALIYIHLKNIQAIIFYSAH